MKLYHFIITSILFFALPNLIIAAPDPTELKVLKEETPLHIVGEVLEDELVKVHKKEEHDTQTRVMTIKIHEIIRQKEHSYKNGEVIKVAYHYLPTWVDYSGGGSIQVVKGDNLKLWLQFEDGKFTPLLGISGVEMVKANGDRIEHVNQPLLQKVKGAWLDLAHNHLPYAVGVFILLLLTVIIWLGSKSR